MERGSVTSRLAGTRGGSTEQSGIAFRKRAAPSSVTSVPVSCSVLSRLSDSRCLRRASLFNGDQHRPALVPIEREPIEPLRQPEQILQHQQPDHESIGREAIPAGRWFLWGVHNRDYIENRWHTRRCLPLWTRLSWIMLEAPCSLIHRFDEARIPDFRPDDYLPVGQHACAETEAVARFGQSNRVRRRLAVSLQHWCELGKGLVEVLL